MSAVTVLQRRSVLPALYFQQPWPKTLPQKLNFGTCVSLLLNLLQLLCLVNQFWTILLLKLLFCLLWLDIHFPL